VKFRPFHVAADDAMFISINLVFNGHRIAEVYSHKAYRKYRQMKDRKHYIYSYRYQAVKFNRNSHLYVEQSTHHPHS